MHVSQERYMHICAYLYTERLWKDKQETGVEVRGEKEPHFVPCALLSLWRLCELDGLVFFVCLFFYHVYT